MSHSMILFITGGVKSGKSALGMACAESLTPVPHLIATARRTDAEMERRIDRHIKDRGDQWQCSEAPIQLAETLQAIHQPVLIDCLGTWLTNVLVEAPDTLPISIETFTMALMNRQHPTIVISNECGLGVIGADALTRTFIDELGLLNQKIAKLANHVALTASGIPIWLKGGEPNFLSLTNQAGTQ